MEALEQQRVSASRPNPTDLCCVSGGVNLEKLISFLFLLLIFGMTATAQTNINSKPTLEKSLREQGAFLFPQQEAKVLCNTPELRLSIWNNEELLFAQAILWKDDSRQIGTDGTGRQLGDSSTLLLDLDANSAPTPKVDRVYVVNPRLEKSGLDYWVMLGRGMWTDIIGDTKGTGSICYIRLDSGRLARVDSYAIPLNEIKCKTGQKIRIAYSARSAVPVFKLKSVAVTIQDEDEWCCGIPVKKYQEYVLSPNQLHEPDLKAIAATWAQATENLLLSQRITNSNEKWFITASFSLDFDKLKLPQNSPNALPNGLLDNQVLQEFLTSLGIRPDLHPKLHITSDPITSWIEVKQNGAQPAVFELVCKEIRGYIDRSAGHTRDYLLASFRERGHPLPTNVSPVVKAFMINHPEVPFAWIRVQNTGSGVASIGVVDGELAWCHSSLCHPNGKFSQCLSDLCDSKEFDPKYTNIIAQVEKEIGAKMKANGTYKTLGSCYSFWARKKELLKAKGIDWRSPHELNPNTTYD
jgi:hypothetical protein